MDEQAGQGAADGRARPSGDDVERVENAPTDPSIEVVCRQVVELVTDYLEGALPDPLHAAVERHLQLCPPCETYLDQLRTTAASLREIPVESIHPQTRAELVAAFRGLIPPSPD